MQICRTILLLLIALAAPAAAAQDDVDIALETFGVAGAYRAGDFSGLRLQLKSNLAEPQQVQVVWEVPESSGDIMEVMREIALTPGLPISTWLYTKLLPSVDPRTTWAVRVYADNDGERGSELGGAMISPSTAMVPPAQVNVDEGMIALVGGTNTAGLSDYNQSNMSNGGETPFTGHEMTRIVSGLSPSDLPDRWEGLDSFEAIVWTDAAPGGLRQGQADAIREYLTRGGHLVIVLPAAGNDWGLGAEATHPLHDLLPTAATIAKTVRIEELLPVLSKRRRIDPADNIEFTIQTFATLDNGYEPLVVLPDAEGTIVTVQRVLGFGRITLVGIELHSGQLGRPRNGRGGGLLEGDAAWNRILGRRVDTLHASQFNALSNNNELYTFGRNLYHAGGGDTFINAISLRGGAIVGVLFAFLLFVVYWLASGVLGFAVLKSMKMVRHAWVAFALTSAAFTVIAWVGVKVFSQKDVEVQHLTVLDLIAPAPGTASGTAALARASSWFTVFLPGYGTRDLVLASDPGARDLLAPFTPPNSSPARFPNVARYVLPVRSPAAYGVPARATSKEMQARWMGALPGDWAGGFEIVQPVRFNPRTGQIEGVIGHNLPGDLQNVRLYIVTQRRTQPKIYNDETGVDPSFSVSGPLLNVTNSWSVTEGLASGKNLDLSRYPGNASFDREIQSSYERVVGTDDEGNQYPGQTFSSGTLRNHHDLLSFYGMIPTPRYLRSGEGFDGAARPALKRVLGRELDLSPWLTRPCVIIVGELQGSSLPLPLTVDGNPVEGHGLTLVRWICPIEPAKADLVE